MKWPWVSRRRLEALERRHRDAVHAEAQQLMQSVYAARDRERLEAEALQRELAALKSAYAAQALTPPSHVASSLPKPVLDALNERAPVRGSRGLRAALERDAREMLQLGAQPEVVAAVILDGDRPA